MSWLREVAASLGLPPGRWRQRVSPKLVETLFDLAGSVASSEPFERRMTELCGRTAALLGCDRSSIFLREGGVFRARFNHGNPPDVAALFPSHRVPPDDPLIREALARRSYVMLNDALASPLMHRATAQRARIRAIAVAPLFDANDDALGFITAEFNENPGRFDILDATLLLGVARLAQLAARDEEARRDRTRSERRATQLETRVRDFERIEALGRLAGGVAHDFNNVLTVILGCSEQLAERLAEDPVAAQELRQIQESATRASDLTRQLLAFGRRQVLQPRVLDPAAVVRDMLPFLSRLLPENVEVALAVAPGLGRVCADRAQLEQVILNLVLNARDAMPAGGRIDIGLADLELEAGAPGRPPGARGGPYVRLAVRDSGPGIPPEHLERVFEPFFTTRGGAGGSGLGLATVLGIVEQSGGEVVASSTPGVGACFEVRLPRDEREPDVVASPPAPDARGRETVLLVDDDAAVRRVTQRSLETRGYRVLAASDGESARAVARLHPGAIDLLVTDVVMPGEGGHSLASALRAEREGLRVLFISGYDEGAIQGNGSLGPGVFFLAKPFTPSTLSERVREILDRAVDPA
jgi:signal transduction histidine kinase/CheY-like chemotaxis protein